MIAESAFHPVYVGFCCGDGKQKGDSGRLFIDGYKVFGGTGKSGVQSQSYGVQNAGFTAAGGAEYAE